MVEKQRPPRSRLPKNNPDISAAYREVCGLIFYKRNRQNPLSRVLSLGVSIYKPDPVHAPEAHWLTIYLADWSPNRSSGTSA